jgi:hypothetical protein
MLRKMRALKITRQKDDPISSKGVPLAANPQVHSLQRERKVGPRRQNIVC